MGSESLLREKRYMKTPQPSQINLPPEMLDQRIRTLYFTAPHSKAGTTTCILALANNLSGSLSQKVVVIDGNIHSSTLTKRLDLEGQPGFYDYLSYAKKDVSKLLFPFEGGDYHIIPVGNTSTPLPWGIYLRERTMAFMENLCETFDFILFDAPAIYTENCQLSLASVFNGTIMVINSKDTRIEVADGARERLTQMDVNLIGTIFNRRRYHIPKWLYHRL